MHIDHDSLQEFVTLFQKNGIENPLREIRLLLGFATDKSYEQIFFHKEFFLTSEQQAKFEDAVKRRINHEPLSKIMGNREFWGLNFKVTKDTLDPRPDSEVMIEAVLKQLPDKKAALRCLDLGTGTGCLLLSILSEYPNASGVGIDIGENALNVAYENAVNLKLNDRSIFILSSWAEKIDGVFDLIISNPPYIDFDEKLEKNVRDYDPHLALFAGTDGLTAYRDIFSQIARLCYPQTKVFMEIGQGQKEAVIAIALKNGFFFKNSYKDLTGIERVLEFGVKEN